MRLLQQTQTLGFPAPLPLTLLETRQHFDAPQVEDVATAVRNTLEESRLLEQIAPGAKVAVGVGSRGIANLPQIVTTVIERLRATGVQPFVFPAMGSHGGATAEGQRALLAELGVTPENIGAEIRATMEVIPIGQIPDGPFLFQDVNAANADHTLLINRVKSHTDFRSHLESGLSKMAVIGMGKQRGAIAMHAWGTFGFQHFLEPAARIYEANTNLIGGLAILENARGETAKVVSLKASEIGGPKEVKLQKQAKSLMASLPFPEIDVLVLRQMGKDISGTGMDTSVIGRLMIPREPENLGGPDIALIVVLDLTKESHGNAGGVGLANVTTVRVASKIDWVATYTNAVTSGIFGMMRASLPISMADDRRALQVAMRCCGRTPETARVVFAQDTLALEHLWVSPSLKSVVEDHPCLSIAKEIPLSFTDGGNMTSPWQLD